MFSCCFSLQKFLMHRYFRLALWPLNTGIRVAWSFSGVETQLFSNESTENEHFVKGSTPTLLVVYMFREEFSLSAGLYCFVCVFFRCYLNNFKRNLIFPFNLVVYIPIWFLGQQNMENTCGRRSVVVPVVPTGRIPVRYEHLRSFLLEARPQELPCQRAHFENQLEGKREFL